MIVRLDEAARTVKGRGVGWHGLNEGAWLRQDRLVGAMDDNYLSNGQKARLDQDLTRLDPILFV
ncbi:MAG: hypothetical protein ABI167_03580 [Nitrosospira sp.]